jgi:hypothetical protein
MNDVPRTGVIGPASLVLCALLWGCGGTGDDAAPGADSASGLVPGAATDSIPARFAATGAGSAAAPVDAADLARLESLWTAQRYAEVLPALKEHRRTAPYGKNEIVDYMIATSACRVPGEEALGRQMLLWILSHYNLNPESREMVNAERRRCPPTATMIPVSLSLVGVGPASTSGTRGKMFYDIGRGEDVPLANEPVVVHRAIPIEELEARQFPPEEAASAVAAVGQLAGPGYRVEAHEAFVLASRGHTSAQLARLASGLSRYVDFYATEYGIPRPPRLITVYLVENAAEMREVAERVHGIGVSPSSIGYSFRDDLSMVGIIPGEIYGTLAHELFHLLVRRDFGDVPPWLDEGMAALYEVSQVEANGDVRGLPNWRGRVLEAVWYSRPSIADLVGADWQAFEAQVGESDPVRQAANHATARYFVLYLQEHELLVDVYRAFRERDAARIQGEPAEQAVQVIESVVGMPAPAMDARFAAWFEAL